MSALEKAVKPILGPMMTKGWVTPLSPPTQRLLAFWAVKTALVIEYLHPRHRVVPDAHYSALYAAQSPPPGVMVWIARRNAYGDLMSSSLKEAIGGVHIAADNPSLQRRVLQLANSGQAKMYRFTFTIGHVVFQVFGHNFPMKMEIGGGEALADVVQRIWPIDEDITWPAARCIEDIPNGLLGLHAAWNPPADQAPPIPAIAPFKRPERAKRKASHKATRRRRR